LWSEHPELKEQKTDRYVINLTPPNSVDPPPNTRIIRKVVAIRGVIGDAARSWVELIASQHTTAFGQFVPLVRESNGFNCELTILFLRRDAPGSLFTQGGDIDNRIKRLLDGLRMPQNKDELGGDVFGECETPLYCLLQDDKLITSMNVVTDRLLEPVADGEEMSDVQLITHVTIINPGAIFAGGVLV
jgi:hypothetical protein